MEVKPVEPVGSKLTCGTKINVWGLAHSSLSSMCISNISTLWAWQSITSAHNYPSLCSFRGIRGSKWQSDDFNLHFSEPLFCALVERKKSRVLVQGKVSKWIVRCISVTDRIIKMSSPTKISSPSYSTDINLGNSVETLVMSNQMTLIWHYLGLLSGFNVFIWTFKNWRRRQKGHSDRCRGEIKHKAPEVKETEI